MGVFSRLSDIVNSNLSALLDRAEDPQKIVRLIIQEMEDTLVETRTAAARTIADRKDLARRIGELAAAGTDWQRKAELAVSRGRDDLAKLQAKLTEAKNKQKAFEIRHVAARDQIRIRTQLHDSRLDEALARYAALERRLDQMEARAESFDLGEARGLAQEFAALEAEGRVERELAELKERLGRG